MICSTHQMNQARPIRVIVADQHSIARLGMRDLLGQHGMEIVGEACTNETLTRLVDSNEADVAVVNACHGRFDGVAALATLRKQVPKLPVVVYADSENTAFFAGALMHGAAGFVAKSDPAKRLAEAIRAVASGGRYWPEERQRRRLGTYASLPLTTDIAMPLTRRETEVLVELAQGKSNQQIGDSLHIGYETVKEHMKHILKKISVTDRTQAAVWAVRNKVVK